LSQQLKKSFAAIGFEYRVTEPEMKLEIKKTADSGWPLAADSQARLLNLILVLPHGVISCILRSVDWLKPLPIWL